MFGHRFTLPINLARAFSCVAIVFVVLGLSALEHIVRPHDADPHWWQLIAPVAIWVALPLSLIAFVPTKPDRERGTRNLAIASVCLSVTAFLLLFALPRIPFCGEPADRIKCASNLHQIGMALQIDAAANGGAFPDELEMLPKTVDITSEVFICPMAEGRSHTSYTYLGKDKASNLPADEILAYEASSDHNGMINVLYGDGHVEGWRTLSALQQYMATTKPTTQSTTPHNPATSPVARAR